MSSVQQLILGAYPNDGAGDDLRTAFTKTQLNINLLNTDKVENGANLSNGVPILLGKNGTNLEFRTIKTANSNLSISFDSSTITLEVANASGSVVEDITPSLGGNLDLNSFDIFGTGNIDISGNINAQLAQIETLEISNILYSPNLSNPNVSQLDIYSAGTISINSSEQMYLEISQAFAGDGASLSILAGSGGEETSTMNGDGGNVFISAGNGPFGPAAVGGSVYISGGNGVVKGGDIILSSGDSNSDVIINNLKYPRTDGTPGQVLSTNGSRLLDWVDPPVGGGNLDFGTFSAPSGFSLDLGSF
jgi:hypothetical protein